MSFVFFEGEKRIVENGSKLNSGDKSSLTNYFEKRFSLFLLCVFRRRRRDVKWKAEESRGMEVSCVAPQEILQ